MDITELQKLKLTLSLDIGNEISDRCLACLSDELVRTGLTLVELATQPLDIESTRHVYERRSRMNAHANGLIRGYEALMPRLESESRSVSIDTVANTLEYFVVFTVSARSVLLGVLACQSGHVYKYFSSSTAGVLKSGD